MIAVPNVFEAAEYLQLEQQSPHRHEFRQGLVYAMAGGTDNHDRIAFNLLRAIDNHLGEHTDCRFYSGNVKVSHQERFYYYPDAFVTCDPRDRADRLVKRYPKLIVEVLSPSTQAFDQGDKFRDYQAIATLEEYVLVSADQPRVECRRRPAATTASDDWATAIYGPGEWVVLASLGLQVPIEQLYRGLD